MSNEVTSAEGRCPKRTPPPDVNEVNEHFKLAGLTDGIEKGSRIMPR